MTNSIWFLPQVDEIIMLENGRIVEMGSYDELVNRGGIFSVYLAKHRQEDKEDEENEENQETK